MSLDLPAAASLLVHRAAASYAVATAEGDLPGPREWSWSGGSVAPHRFAAFLGAPVSHVDVLSHAEHDGRSWTRSRDDAALAADVRTLLTALLSPTPDDTTRELAAAIARALAAFGDLARVTIGGEPLCLLGRSAGGHTFALRFTPYGGPPLSAMDRLRLEADVLGEYVWLNNNERLRVDHRVESHGLADPTDAAFRAWWPSSATAAWFAEEYPACEELPIEPLDAAALASVRAEFLDFNVAEARGGAWAMELIGDDDPQPDFPGRRLVELLSASVVDGVIGEAGAPTAAYRIGYTDDQDYGPVGAFLFLGPERLGVVAIDASV